MKFKNKKVLVTGSNGMIGRQLVKLLKNNFAIVTETDLPVDLLGTIVIDPPEQSIAWIKDTSQNQATGYGIGDDLLGQAKIETIEQTQVSISRNGAIEIIKFSKDAKKTNIARQILVEIWGGF